MLARRFTEPYWAAWLRWNGRGRWLHRPYYRAQALAVWHFRQCMCDARGKVFIDCGANVGEISAVMLAAGGIVYAFEPDPIAAAALRKSLGSHPNLTLIEKAVGANARRDILRSPSHPGLEHTIASSFFTHRDNDGRRSTEIEVVDLFEFVRSLGCHVAAIKMDVEGAEFEILERFLDEPLPVDRLFVEMHERMQPSFQG